MGRKFEIGNSRFEILAENSAVEIQAGIRDHFGVERNLTTPDTPYGPYALHDPDANQGHRPSSPFLHHRPEHLPQILGQDLMTLWSGVNAIGLV